MRTRFRSRLRSRLRSCFRANGTVLHSSVEFAICRVFKGHYQLPKKRWAVDVRPIWVREKIFFRSAIFFQKYFFDQKKSKNRVEIKKFAKRSGKCGALPVVAKRPLQSAQRDLIHYPESFLHRCCMGHGTHNIYPVLMQKGGACMR